MNCDPTFTEALETFQTTPGPWMLFPDGTIGSAAVRLPEHTVLQRGSVKGATIGAACRNARLIAQAPNLRSALQWLLDDMTDAGEARNPQTGELYDSVANAIDALARCDR